MKNGKLRELIDKSGFLVPSVALEAIKVDFAKEIAEAQDKSGGDYHHWLCVDECGSIFAYRGRPMECPDGDNFWLNGDGICGTYIGYINRAMCYSLRMDIYWREYLVEL